MQIFNLGDELYLRKFYVNMNHYVDCVLVFQQETHTLHSVFLYYLVISVTWYILCTRDVLVIIEAICSSRSLEEETQKEEQKTQQAS